MGVRSWPEAGFSAAVLPGCRWSDRIARLPGNLYGERHLA